MRDKIMVAYNYTMDIVVFDDIWFNSIFPLETLIEIIDDDTATIWRRNTKYLELYSLTMVDGNDADYYTWKPMETQQIKWRNGKQ